VSVLLKSTSKKKPPRHYHIIFILLSDVAHEETNHLFVAADDDHDDRLSYDEIVNKYDVFVGSEATDYGDHLHNLDQFDHDEL
jgi:hypothetical protein